MPATPTPQEYRVAGFDALTGEPIELWVQGARLVEGPLAYADTICTDGWILPGLVDAHNHVGIAPGLGVTIAQAREFAHADAAVGALLLREVGSPLDTHPLDADLGGPKFVRSGSHIARPKRYLRGYGVELEDPADLPAEVRRQARRSDGWVKIVGDWIDREIGDLAPLWDDDVLVDAVIAAHEEGARITAHVFGTDALAGLIAAGVDCIEHGTGLTADLIDAMSQRSITLVPTLIQVENFPSIADSADRFPAYQRHMRKLYDQANGVFAAAREAGVVVFTGTDAGGFVRHGRLVDELEALVSIGMSAVEILQAATVTARAWLGAGVLTVGAPADLLVLAGDPRADLRELRTPLVVMADGLIVFANGVASDLLGI